MNRFIQLSQTSDFASSLHVSLFEDDRVYGGYSAVCVHHETPEKTALALTRWRGNQKRPKVLLLGE